MSKSYLSWLPFQPFLLPPCPADWLPQGHLAWFILELVDQLDIGVIEGRYQSKDARGQRPYAPKMMVSLLLYSYCVGEPSSRQIERLTYEDIAYRILAGGQHPDHKAISEFRRVHLDELKKLFYQVLTLCRQAGLAKLGHVALDGTKVEANASKHKAMSYERMKATEERLQKEIDELMGKAETVDRVEDSQFGAQGRGDWKLEDELSRREARLARIKQARAELEAAAAAARARELVERAQNAEQTVSGDSSTTTLVPVVEEGAANTAQVGVVVATERNENIDISDIVDVTAAADAGIEVSLRKAAAHAQKVRKQADEATDMAREKARAAGLSEPDLSPRAATELPSHQVPHTAEGLPTAKAQWNFTDSDSRIMKHDGEFIQAYNCQAAVDSEHQIIVEISVTNQAPDPEHMIPVFSKLHENQMELPKITTADTGYWSEENAAWCEQNAVDAHIATKRDKHGESPQSPTPDTSEGNPPPPQPSELKKPPEKIPHKARMAAKLATREGKAVYKRRKAIVEPVFGQIKAGSRQLSRFLLRGLEKVEGEWALFCLTHNVLKMFRANVSW